MSTTVRDLSQKVNNLRKVVWDYQIVHHVYKINQTKLKELRKYILGIIRVCSSLWTTLAYINLLFLPITLGNKSNGKRFNNRVYSLFFIMNIFLKHLWLIPNILKQQSCKIFTKLAPSPTPSRSNHQKCFVKKGVLKSLRSFKGRHRCRSLF